MWIYIVGGAVFFFVVYLIVQRIRCSIAEEKSKERLSAYGAETVNLEYGNISFVDRGKGESILSIHGIFGGYDQAYDTCKDFSSDYRIIAPSRFGYLGSDILGNGTPAEQATAYVSLLDKLGIEKSVSVGNIGRWKCGYTFCFGLSRKNKRSDFILFCYAAYRKA